jgi:hypothetical protein
LGKYGSVGGPGGNPWADPAATRGFIAVLLTFAFILAQLSTQVSKPALGTFPVDPEFGRDKLLLALKYKATGDEKKMLPLLKELAEAKVAHTEMGGLMDGVDGVGPGTQSYARATLAEHYFAKREWADALKWYEAWKLFVQGCGLSIEAAQNYRANRITTCQKGLGLKP